MAGQQIVDPVTQNLIARRNLLLSGMQMVKRLAPVSCTENQTTKIPLLRMGIMTGVLLQFTIAFTVAAGTGDTVTLSPVGPWNAVKGISYTDFAGAKRTTTNGFQLWQAQNFKMGDTQSAISTHPRILGAPSTGLAYDLFNSSNNVLNATGSISAAGVVAETASAELTFSLYVPMAYDPQGDLTGAILTQTNVGEHYIDVTLGSLVGPDVWANLLQPASGAVLSAYSVTCEAFQHYIQPQDMSVNNIPVIDLSTIYGFEGGFETTANIQSNMDSYLNYPNNRSVLSTIVNFQDNNAFNANGSDLTQITLIANSNTNLKEMSARYMKEMQRNLGNYDAPGATFFMNHRRQPILTQLYANVQLKMSVGTLGGASTTKFISQYEVQYASGAPLPGVTIAA